MTETLMGDIREEKKTEIELLIKENPLAKKVRFIM